MGSDTTTLTDLDDSWSKQKIIKPSGRVPLIAGVILLITGAIAILFGIVSLLLGTIWFETDGLFFIILSVAYLFNGSASIIGGVCAIQRLGSKYVLWGAIFNILTFIIPGIIVLILVIISSDEFES